MLLRSACESISNLNYALMSRGNVTSVRLALAIHCSLQFIDIPLQGVLLFPYVLQMTTDPGPTVILSMYTMTIIAHASAWTETLPPHVR